MTSIIQTIIRFRNPDFRFQESLIAVTILQIAVGSVVNKSFPDNSIIGGVPANY